MLNKNKKIIKVTNELIPFPQTIIQETDQEKTTVTSPKRRGRKPKVISSNHSIEENLTLPAAGTTLGALVEAPQIIHEEINENITVTLEETSIIDNINNIVLDKNIFLTSSNDPALETEKDKLLSKKRGRKPKGGKIISQIMPLVSTVETKPNVILHLKCSFKDLHVDNLFGAHLDSYSFSSNSRNQPNISYEIIKSDYEISNNESNASSNSNISLKSSMVEENNDDKIKPRCDKDVDIREIWKKLKVLEHNLHVNNICDKKSACFWCTYDFDNPPIYIPKHYIKDSYQVYGCFCSPECATSYLMDEHIDSSAKFERYQLINHIYSKIYNYSKNIKPAPNPFYMLEKYYGKLTIQEYRALLRNERLFLIVDKPLTRIMPELHEDNDDFIINNKIIPSNNFQVKKKLMKKQTKSNILNEKFGLASAL